MFKKIINLAIVFFGAISVSAEESSPKLAPLRFFGNWEVSEIESFVPDPGSTPSGYPREISNSSSVWVLQEARLTDYAKVFMGVGGFYFFILPSKSNQYSIGQRSAFGFTDLHAEFEYQAKENGDHLGLLKLGVFPFKYNPDAKNLGEYLFRTFTYPTVIYTGGLNKVNSAAVQLNGFDLNTKINGFENDLLVTVKTDQIPSASLSLTDIVSYSVGNILDIGAGWMYDNFYDPSKIAGGTADVQGFNYYYTLKDGTKKLKSPQNPSDIAYDANVDTAVDSTRLTFKGHKIMLRGALSLGSLINSPLLSEKDLRLYFEGVLLGLENRPFYYTEMKDRIVYTVGLNLPTLKLLDLLSLEWEYCSNRYPNDAINASINLSPTPFPSKSSAIGDNAKWTIYAKKHLFSGMSVTGQVANDHLRLVDYFGHTNDRDVMPNRENWYWAIQLGYAL